MGNAQGNSQEDDLSVERTSSHDDDDVNNTAADMAIDCFVEKILANKNCNIRWMPDAIEKAMYRNVMHLIIGYIESITESVEIRVANHKITIAMEPVQRLDANASSSKDPVDDSG